MNYLNVVLSLFPIVMATSLSMAAVGARPGPLVKLVLKSEIHSGCGLVTRADDLVEGTAKAWPDWIQSCLSAEFSGTISSKSQLLAKVTEVLRDCANTQTQVEGAQERTKFEIETPKNIKLVTLSDGKQVESIFKKQVLSTLQKSFLNQEVELTKLGALGVSCAQGSSIEVGTTKIDAKGSGTLALKVDGQDRLLAFQYKSFGNSYVSKQQLSTDIKLQASDFELKRVELTYASDRQPTLDDIVGRKLARPLIMGTKIELSDLKKDPDVERGQTVQIRFKSIDLEISTTGTSEMAGKVGDWIKIKNNDNQKILSALVVDKGQVEVQ